MEFRRATPDEAERLSAIARAAKASWGYPPAWLSAWESSLQITSEYLQRQLVFVGLQGQEPVGFYALEQRAEGWWLEHLWVAPSWHGRGAGRRLFEHALDSVRRVRPGKLVIEADPYAAGFYARMGARRTGTLAAPVAGDPSRTLPVFEVEVSAARQRDSRS